MAKKQRAALICRVSTPKQIRLGLDSQVAVLKRKAIDDGYDVLDELIFQEQISGLDANQPIRKSLQDLMNAVEEHKVDVCYTYELTRISRDPFNLVERVKWFSDRKIPMYIYVADLWTLNRDSKKEIDETTNYVFSKATSGKYEVEIMKERIKRSKDEVARKGLYIGHLSDGYCVVQTENGKEIKIDEDRKKVIKRIFDLYQQGYTIDKIAETLNADKIPTASNYRFNSPKFKGYQESYHKKGSKVPISRKDTRWQGSIVSTYLRNRWYVGERTYNKQAYSIDPIIATNQWNIVSSMLEQNAANFRSKKKSTKHSYLLSGLLFCGKCGRKMYGHYTGLNNHYYCSSIEEGTKCGLVGVNKENIEAIVALAVKAKGTIDVLNGTEDSGLVLQFFKMNENEKRNLKKQYKTNEKQIQELNQNIEDKCAEIKEAYKKSIENKDKSSLYEEIAQEFEKERDELLKTREKITSENILISKRLNKEDNLSKQISQMVDERDLSVLSELFSSVIDKIIVYNLTKSIHVIRINYVNSYSEDFIYSYRLLKQGIIPLKHAVLNEEDLIHYDEDLNSLISSKEGALYNGRYVSNEQLQMAFDEEETSPEEIVELISSSAFMWLESDVNVKEFIRYCKNTIGVPSFERLEELSDEAKEQNARYKEWRKKYNTGLPTCVPYVIKDASYEEISLKKKHLYNRKYKVKKHKKLTDEERRLKLEEIDKELAILTAKVKYMNRTDAVEAYRKNNNNKG